MESGSEGQAWKISIVECQGHTFEVGRENKNFLWYSDGKKPLCITQLFLGKIAMIQSLLSPLSAILPLGLFNLFGQLIILGSSFQNPFATCYHLNLQFSALKVWCAPLSIWKAFCWIRWPIVNCSHVRL